MDSLTRTNKAGEEIIFYPNDHRYTIDGEEVISVTTWIKQFFPAFDAQAVSKRYAQKVGKTQAEVLAEWDHKREARSHIGDCVHYYAEKKQLGDPRLEPTSGLADDSIRAYFPLIDQAIEQLEERFKFVGTELIVGSKELGLAGMIDTVWWEKEIKDDSHAILLGDWKTNQKLKMDNPWRKALPPIEHLDDCEWFKYSLQLNTYRTIYQLTEDNDPVRMAICHIDPELGRPRWIKVTDMTMEVERMLNWI